MRALSFPSTLVLVSLSSLALSAPRATAQSEAGAPLLAPGTVLSAPAPQSGPERVKQSLARLRIPFIANESRIDRRVSYYASTFAGAVYVTRDGTIVYSLQAPGKSASSRDANTRSAGWSLTETLVGGKARPHGDGLTPTRASYFIGNDPTHWKTDLATYDSVSLGEVWPGVDVRLRAYGRTMEKLFTVRPGAKAIPDSSSHGRGSIAAGQRRRSAGGDDRPWRGDVHSSGRVPGAGRHASRDQLGIRSSGQQLRVSFGRLRPDAASCDRSHSAGHLRGRQRRRFRQCYRHRPGVRSGVCGWVHRLYGLPRNGRRGAARL